MKFFVFFAFFLLYNSCNKTIEVETFESKETIIFNIGFKPEFRFAGSFFDEINNEEVIYFAEPVTNKQIKFFNAKGEFLDSINLESLSKSSSHLNSLKIISRDTIMFLNYNEIIVLNKNGRVCKRVDLKKVISNNASNDIFEFTDSFRGNKYTNKEKMILGLSWSSNKFDNKTLSYEDFFIKSFSKPSIIRLDNYLTDSITYKFSSQNHYKSWYKEPKIFSEGFNYRQINGQLFIFSFFSNEILIFDIEKLKVIRKISINSNLTSIGIEPYNVNETEFSGEKAMVKAKSAGAITDIFYLANKKQYYVLVRHELDEEKILNEKERPFSIIKYDSFFNKLSEMVINDTDVDFYGYSVLETKDGFMMLNKKNTNEKMLSFSIIK